MNSAFINQTRRNIELLISQKKFREAHNLCNDILSRYPEERDFEKMREFIEKKSEKANEELIEEKIKELDPLWDQEKYPEILSAIKYLFKYAPNNDKLKKLYIKAQGLYTKQVGELKKQFQKEKTEKLNRLFEEDPDHLMNELYILERTNPGNQDILKLSKSFREKLVHKKLANKDELLNSGKYDVIDNFILELKKIDESNVEIMKLEKIVKQKKLNNQKEQKKEFIYKGENYLSTLIGLKKFAEAIRVAQEVLSIDADDPEAKKLLAKAQEGYYKQTTDQSIDMIDRDLPKLKAQYENDKSKFIKL